MNEYVAGSTSIIEVIDLLDSTSTTGAGKTGLVYNVGSPTCYYKRSNGTASVPVTLWNITTLGTFVSGGFKEIDATNQPGLYEFHPPDAALASGAKWVVFVFIFSGAVIRKVKVRLLSMNPDDSVRGGFTALPNTACTGNASLITSGTGTDQLSVSTGAALANLGRILGTALTETVGGYLTAGFKKLLDVATPVFTVASVNQTGDSYARVGTPVGASISADIASVKTDTGTTIPGKLPAALTANGNIKASLTEILTTSLTETVGGYLAAAFKKFLDVAAPVFTSASVNQTGDSYARLGAPAGASTAADVAAIKTDTGSLAKLIYASGTASAGSATTITPAVGLPATNSAQGFTIVITGGTGVGQSRVVASNTTTVLTVDSSWITNPDATSTYVIFATRSPIVNANGSAAADMRHVLNFGLSETTGGNIRSGIKTFFDVATGSQALTIAGKNQTGDSFALIGTTGSGLTSLATQASVNAISTTIGVAGAGLTGIVSVGSVTNPIVLPTMPTDWITAAGLSAGAVSEIQNGLATSTAVAALPSAANIAAVILKFPNNLLYTETSTGYVTATNGGGGGGGSGLTAAETRAALGMAAPNLDDQLDAILAEVGGVIGGSGSPGTADSVEAHTGFYGLTGVTATLYPDDVSTPDATGISCTADSRPGCYTFANPSLTGMHLVQLFRPGVVKPFWYGWADLSVAGIATCFNDKIQTSASFVSSVADAIGPMKYTVPGAIAQAAQTPGAIACIRGDTLNVTLPDLGLLSGWTKIIFTAKNNPSTDLDSKAILQVVLTSSGSGSGLTQNNGTTIAADPALGSISIVDSLAGTVTVTIDASVTAQLTGAQLFWDCQVEKTSANIVTPVKGPVIVSLDVTQTTT